MGFLNGRQAIILKGRILGEAQISKRSEMPTSYALPLQLARVGSEHQLTGPPVREAQPRPPHVPQEAAQQISSFWTPTKPLEHSWPSTQ